MIWEFEIDPAPLKGKSIAVVGYGNQGRAHSLNLRDRGLKVRVATREGASRQRSITDGFEALSVEDAVRGADIVVMTVPDEAMRDVFALEVAPNLSADATLAFAHGFAVTYGLIDAGPQVPLILVSPSGPGVAVREKFLAGSGVSAFVAALPSTSMPTALAYASAIGCARAGLIETTFREETECDLFGEQTVLCGGMPELASAAFETLVANGYSPLVAYTECVKQIVLLADLVARFGIAGMRERISDTAEWGSYEVGQEVVGDSSRKAMTVALRRIQSGEFARDWLTEAGAGKKRLEELRAQGASRTIEAAHEALSLIDPSKPGTS